MNASLARCINQAEVSLLLNTPIKPLAQIFFSEYKNCFAVSLTSKLKNFNKKI